MNLYVIFPNECCVQFVAKTVFHFSYLLYEYKYVDIFFLLFLEKNVIIYDLLICQICTWQCSIHFGDIEVMR